MTAIVGIAQAGKVHIGGDSAGVGGYQLTVRADAKVFRRGSYIFGFCGSFRVGQLLRYSLDLPEPEMKDLDRFMVVTFADKVRECLKKGGVAKKDNDVEAGGTFLVGVDGRLFTIGSDYQIGEAAIGFDAVGCGDQLALGALHATAGMRMPPRKRLGVALAAAERFSAGVRGPFVYVSSARR